MKKSVVLGAVAGVLAMSPLATAQTPSQLIVGRWSCSADTPDGLISAQMLYDKDGTTRSTMIIGSDSDDMHIEAILQTVSTWRIPGDGTLRERVTDVDVVSFKVNGEAIDSDQLESLKDDLMQDELMSGSLQISAKSLSMVDDQGTRTSCMR
jgi:hypothetical protein